MYNFNKLEIKLKDFAQQVPEDGMYMSYLNDAAEIMDLYGSILSIMENKEETPENIKKIEDISGRILNIIS